MKSHRRGFHSVTEEDVVFLQFLISNDEQSKRLSQFWTGKWKCNQAFSLCRTSNWSLSKELHIWLPMNSKGIVTVAKFKNPLLGRIRSPQQILPINKLLCALTNLCEGWKANGNGYILGIMILLIARHISCYKHRNERNNCISIVSPVDSLYLHFSTQPETPNHQ